MKARPLNKRNLCYKYKHGLLGFIYFVRDDKVFFNDGTKVVESSYSVLEFLADIERNPNNYWVKVS